MKIKVLEETKKKMLFEAEGLGHTFFNALVDVLNNESGVEIAAYTIRHPLIGIPQVIVETDGKTAPRKAIQEAVKKLKKVNAKIRNDLQTALR